MKELIGKEVFVRPQGNAERIRPGQVLKAKISEVSRVFVHLSVEGGRTEKLRLLRDNVLNDDYNSGYLVFESEKAARDSIEAERLATIIVHNRKGIHELSKLPVENLQKIAVLMNIDTN